MQASKRNYWTRYMPQLQRPVAFQPRGLPPIEWTTFEEAGAWLDRELAEWQPLRSGQLIPVLQQLRNELMQPIERAANAVNTVRGSPSASVSAISSAQSEVQAFVQQYPSGPLIASASPDGQMILDRVRSGDLSGAILEVAFRVNNRELTVPLQGHQVSAKLVVAEAARAVIDDIINDRRNAAHQASHESILAEFSQRLQSALDRFEKDRLTLLQSQQMIEQSVQRGERQESQVRKLAFKYMRDLRAELDAIKKTYISFMSLKAPGDYWRARGIRSHVAWVVSLLVFVAAAAAAGWLAIEYAYDIKMWLTDTGGKIDVAAVLLLSPAVVLVLWFFRMLARLQSVGLSESVDAGQRRVMLATFHSLTSDPNSKLSDAERFLILQALFRPSGSKDEPDTLPANAIEAVIRALQGRH